MKRRRSAVATLVTPLVFLLVIVLVIRQRTSPRPRQHSTPELPYQKCRAVIARRSVLASVSMVTGQRGRGRAMSPAEILESHAARSILANGKNLRVTAVRLRREGATRFPIRVAHPAGLIPP